MKKIAYKEMSENEFTHGWYIGTREMMLTTLKNVKKSAKILDAGCGTGGTLLILKTNGYKKIYGIDKSSYAISLCKKKGIKNVKVADVKKIPFEESTFDVIICMDVLYHQGVGPQQACHELYRVLKKKGILYSQEPAYEWLRSEHDRAIETERRFTKKSLLRIFKSSGFKSIKISYFDTIFFLPIALKRVIDKLFKKGEIDSDVYKLPNILNKCLLASLRLERVILEKINLPFGVSVISVWRK